MVSLPRRRPASLLAPGLAALLLAGSACSGGSGGDEPGLGISERYANRCELPRIGFDPITLVPYPDVLGSRVDEKRWIREWTYETYLWYREVADVDPRNRAYDSPQEYFEVMKTFATTSSGRPKDRYHFAIPTSTWNAYIQGGAEVGYGVAWARISDVPPRVLTVAFVEPGSPADGRLARGDTVLAVDGVSIDATDPAGVDVLNAGLFDLRAGATHTLQVQAPSASAARLVTLTAAAVTLDPVPLVDVLDVGERKVGYVLFNSHIATAEAALAAAVEQLRAAAIDDLVLDLRYNGGGYLGVAAGLAFEIAGPGPTAGRTFEELQFNDKYTTTDPWGAEILPLPFLDRALGYDGSFEGPLPHLDLARVFILTSGNTCSASESIINGLRGLDFPVTVVGTTTCGKPYAFRDVDNCGTTYLTIQMRSVNAKGFGDYGDGFTPGGSGVAGVPGCQVADDLRHPLGDPQEAQLATALRLIGGGACAPALRSAAPLARPRIVRPPWAELRIQ